MKKFLLLILCGLVLFCVASCNATDAVDDNEYQTETVASLKNETSTSDILSTGKPSDKDLKNSSEETKKSAGKTNYAFITENISGITFYGYHDYGTGKGSEVPQEHMGEIIDWLDTFTVGEKVPDLLPPGTNTVHIEIVYSDGTIFESGMDTVRVNGAVYYIERDKTPPECYYEILSHTS